MRLWVLLGIFWIVPVTGHAQIMIEEYTLKAVFLEKFTHFIEWSPPLSSDTTQPFVIGVVGNTPLDSTLKKLYATRHIQHRPVEIRHFSAEDSLTGIHVLFIAASEKERLPDYLQQVADKPVLTVGDTPGYAQQGVHINFFLKGDHLRFEVNETAVRKSGLDVSYLLLQTAKIVNPVKDP